MTNGINFDPNSKQSYNFFINNAQSIQMEETEKAESTTFSYDPVIEEDTEGVVEIEDSEQKKQNDKKSKNDGSVIQNVLSGINTIGSGIIKGAFYDIGGGLVNGTINLGKGFVEGFPKQILGLYKIGTAPILGLGKGITNFWTKSGKGITQLAQGDILGGLKSMGKGIGSLFTESLKWAWDGTKTFVDGCTSIVKGVGKGIKSVAEGVVDGVKSVGKAIGKGIKKLFSG